MNVFPEADWKYMRAIKSILLERLCERINQKTSMILNDSSQTAYERYLSIYKKTQKDDADIASAFDDWRRSTIFVRILDIHRQKLLTDEELQGFTPETQERIHFCQPIKNKKF